MNTRGKGDTLQQPLLQTPAENPPYEPTSDAHPPAPEAADPAEVCIALGNPPQVLFPGNTVAFSVILLAKAIVGAGAAALPTAFARLGALTSTLFLLGIAFMTHFSIKALTLGIVASGHSSYPAAVEALMGRPAAAFLELCLVLRCVGLIVVYIVISVDILAGSAALPGLLCEFGGGERWCSDRSLVAAVLCVVILAPLLSTRLLSSAKWTSFIGLAAVCVWAASTVALALIAGWKGLAQPLAWLPDADALGGGSGASQITVALATLPVIATAFTCQMTIAFIVGELKGFAPAKMSLVSAAAVALCTLAVFLPVGLGSCVVFGNRVPADVLEEFNTEGLSHIVGAAAAAWLGSAVRVGFLLSILANFPMQVLPYRQSLQRITLGNDREFSGAWFYVVTYCSLFMCYVVAMAARSIWVPIQLVGATAGAAIAFFYPAGVALAVLRLEGATTAPHGYWRWNSWGLVAVGAVQVVAGIGAILLHT